MLQSNVIGEKKKRPITRPADVHVLKDPADRQQHTMISGVKKREKNVREEKAIKAASHPPMAANFKHPTTLLCSNFIL